MKNNLQILAFLAFMMALVVPLLMPLHPAFASNTTQATYILTIDVNSGSAWKNQTTTFNLSTAIMQAQNYLNPSCNNSAIISDAGADIAYQPAHGSDTGWVLWINSLDALIHKNYFLYVGGSLNMNAKLRYFPGPAGMTTNDSASLELGDNFTVEIDGWFNTTLDDAYFFKANATSFNTGNGNVSAYVLLGTINGTSVQNTYNTGKIGEIYFDLPPCTIPWASVQLMRQGNPTGNGSMVMRRLTDNGIIGYWGNISQSTVPTGNKTWVTFANASVVNPVRQDVRICYETIGSDASNYMNLYQETSGTGFLQGNATQGTGSAWTNITNRDVNILIPYGISTPVASGEHTIRTFANVTDWGIQVDGVTATTTYFGNYSVADNANKYVSFLNGTVPYVKYQKITVNGVLQQHVTWQDADIFSDLSGNNNDAVPSWAVANPNITATITAFAPVHPSESTGNSTEPTPIYATNITPPPENYVAENMTPGFIGADLWNVMLDAGGIPRSFVWFIVAFGSAIGLGFMGYAMVARKAGNTGSALLTQSIISGVVLAFFSVGSNNVVPWYCVIIFAIEALAIILAQKHYGW